jgi:hypothetical protein
MPMYAPPQPMQQQQQPRAYTTQNEPPRFGWAVNQVQTECSAPGKEIKI